MKKITVIVPVYNADVYLEECLDSIIGQSYTNLEIILVNDGSTDNSQKICERYTTQDNRVFLINQKNGGVSRARNTGITYASGDYIMFVDSDDFIDKTICEKLIYKDADLVFCRYHRSDSNEKHEKEFFSLSKLKNVSDIDKNMFEFLYTNTLFNPPVCKLYKKELISEFFREDLDLGEDIVFNLEYLKHCNSIAFLDEELYYYRVGNTSSLSHKYDYERIENTYKVYQITSEQCKELFGANCDVELLKSNFLREACLSIKKIIVLDNSQSIFQKRKMIKKFYKDYNLNKFENEKWRRESIGYRLFFLLLKMKQILLLIMFTFILSRIKKD